MLYALQPFIRCFAVLGLVPWSLEKSPGQQLHKYYTLALVLVNVGVAVHKVVLAPPEGDLLVSLLVSCIVFISQTVSMSVVELQIMCQYKGYKELCLQSKCLRLRFECELQQPIGKLPWQKYAKLVCLGLVNILAFLPSIFVVLHFKYIGYFWYSLGAVLINRFQCLLLQLYAEVLGFHVECLNKRLQGLQIYPHMVSQTTSETQFEEAYSLEYLLSVKRTYVELYRLFDLFNHLFGWSMVCIFVVMFLDCIVNIYWSLLVLAGTYEFAFIYMTSATFVPLLLLLFSFCRCGEYCKRQHMLVGSHVRSLACAAQCLDMPSSQAYNAILAEFAMQVEQDALIITAEGFMDIDYNLLMSIFTAMVTYLIVLMQFGSLYT